MRKSRQQAHNAVHQHRRGCGNVLLGRKSWLARLAPKMGADDKRVQQTP